MLQVMARSLHTPAVAARDARTTSASSARFITKTQPNRAGLTVAPATSLHQGSQRLGQQQREQPRVLHSGRVVVTRASAEVGTTSRVRYIETVEEFEAVIAQKTVTIVDFYAEWCGPCKLIAPSFERLSMAKTCQEATFVKIDVGKFPKDFASKYGIRALPTFQAFVNGEVKDTFVGSRPQELLCFVDRQV